MLNNSEKVSPYDYQRFPLTVSVMRNSRLRIFLYVLSGGAIFCTVYLLSTIHSQLKDVESSREKCLQQRDSLSAQLQVVYEHKNRLEKSLQQEKIEHKHTKEEQDKQKNELHVRMEREKHTLESRYNNILQEQEASQNKLQQLQNELAESKSNYAALEEEKKQLVSALSAQLEMSKQQKEDETRKLKADINQLLIEKEDLQKHNENQVWKIKQHADELQLCRLQYEQLENKANQLTAQLHRRTISNDGKIRESISQAQTISTRQKDHQLPELPKVQKNVEQIIHINDRQNQDKDKQINKIFQDNKEQDKEAEINKDISNEKDQAGQPKLLQRPNVISNAKTPENFQSQDNVLQRPEQNEVHQINKVLEKPYIHEQHDGNVGKDISHNFVDSKIQDSVLHPPHIIKPMDLIQTDEHLPQVQPPHSFDKAEADHNKWNNIPQGGDGFEQYQFQRPNNNHVLALPVKDADIQKDKHGAEDGQEHGVLIKPPLEANQDHKMVQNVEALKRGPQMVNEKNGHHRQQEEEGDYADDGDDDNADDQDAEANEDDQLLVGDHAGHGKVFQDADFDDQDNAEPEEKNVANRDKEEGVMVAPK